MRDSRGRPGGPARGRPGGALQVFATVTLVTVMLAAASLLQRADPAGSATTVAADDVAVVNPIETHPPLDWLAIGAGSKPSDTQVSIEADLTLAAPTLGGPGPVRF